MKCRFHVDTYQGDKSKHLKIYYWEKRYIMNCESPVAQGWPDYSLLTVAVDPKPSSSKPVSSWVHDLNIKEQRVAFIELQLDQARVRKVADLEPVWSVVIPATLC